MANEDHQEYMPMMMTNADEVRELQRQIAAAKQHEAAIQRLSNDNLKDLTAEELVQRLKGVLYRTAAVLKLTELTHMDIGGEIMAASMRSIQRGLLDAIKWIAWKTDQDPYAKFGDDTLIIMVGDMLLGDDLGRKLAGKLRKDRGSQTQTGELRRDGVTLVQDEWADSPVEDDEDMEL